MKNDNPKEEEFDEGYPILGNLSVKICGTLEICKWCCAPLARRCQGGKTPPNHGMLPTVPIDLSS